MMNKMKTNSVLRTLAIVLIAASFSNSLFAQFVGSTINSQLPIVEERKGGTTTYSVPGGPVTDEYTWAVTGATSVFPAAISGDGSVGNPFIIGWTTGLNSIQVTWPADDNTIVDMSGNVSVQQRIPSGTITCPSAIQSWDVSLWSEATANITTADFEICSGDVVGGDITIEFTGAPNFDFSYTITDLDGTISAPVNVNGIDGSTATISLPANLVNTSSTDDQYYIITLTQMNDGFTGDGTILNGTFTITVHPTLETGPIQSSRALTRRP